MIEKTDDALQGVNDFLRTLTDKITPNVVLAVALINGFIIGLVTTGYMGEKSLEVLSLTFFLILWQLLLLCVFSSRYIELTTSYLNKFIVSIAIGYIWQWQFFGMWAVWYNPEITTIKPPIDNTVAGVMFGYATVMLLLGYCFRNNRKNIGKMYSLDKDQNAA